MSLGENKAIVRGFYERAVREETFDFVDELFAPDVHYEGPGGEELTGSEAFKEMLENFGSAFSDVEFAIHDLVAEGDTVVVRYTNRSRHTGDVEGMPASGNEIALQAVAICRVNDGKIIDMHYTWDRLDLLQQVGAIPAEAPARVDAARL